MSKIRVLSDQLANQIAAGEVVERPASVAKELVENAIDAGARRIAVDIEGGGRKLLRVMDDGEGMTRDDALLAFERHATSKIKNAEDLSAIATLGFRGEALASIASVARVELATKTEEAAAATRVSIEGGRMRDVKDAAHPRGTTISVRDLFFNVPARRKFLRSEATESFHLTNLVTHYALAHPEIAFTLTNNGREILRAPVAKDLRERAYQIFGAEFLENLLAVDGGLQQVALASGYISTPLERRTSRDAQYLFVNGRYVRDRLIGRALSDGYRAILPHGVYPAALLFLDVPLEEVDVNVHPAKTEVRFRRAAAVADAVREAVRDALASAGYVRASLAVHENVSRVSDAAPDRVASERATIERDATGRDRAGIEREWTNAKPETEWTSGLTADDPSLASKPDGRATDDRLTDQSESIGRNSATVNHDESEIGLPARTDFSQGGLRPVPAQQNVIEFGFAQPSDAAPFGDQVEAIEKLSASDFAASDNERLSDADAPVREDESRAIRQPSQLPQLVSAVGLVREVPLEALATNIRPLGQLEESYIIAVDDEGLLLIDQHVAHERILFDKYLKLETARAAESQQLLMPETFDLTPAQALIFDALAAELEAYGFGLMRLSGRTVAIKAVPADLPAGEARSLLADILSSISAARRGAARAGLREQIAASLACRAAIKAGTTLAPEKMRWLVDRLLQASSPTTCPHGGAVILRLTTRDIEKTFRRS